MARIHFPDFCKFSVCSGKLSIAKYLKSIDARKRKPCKNFANFSRKPGEIVNYLVSGSKDRKGTKSEITLIT